MKTGLDTRFTDEAMAGSRDCAVAGTLSACRAYLPWVGQSGWWGGRSNRRASTPVPNGRRADGWTNRNVISLALAWGTSTPNSSSRKGNANSKSCAHLLSAFPGLHLGLSPAALLQAAHGALLPGVPPSARKTAGHIWVGCCCCLHHTLSSFVPTLTRSTTGRTCPHRRVLCKRRPQQPSTAP